MFHKYFNFKEFSNLNYNNFLVNNVKSSQISIVQYKVLVLHEMLMIVILPNVLQVFKLFAFLFIERVQETIGFYQVAKSLSKGVAFSLFIQSVKTLELQLNMSETLLLVVCSGAYLKLFLLLLEVYFSFLKCVLDQFLCH